MATFEICHMTSLFEREQVEDAGIANVSYPSKGIVNNFKKITKPLAPCTTSIANVLKGLQLQCQVRDTIDKAFRFLQVLYNNNVLLVHFGSCSSFRNRYTWDLAVKIAPDTVEQMPPDSIGRRHKIERDKSKVLFYLQRYFTTVWPCAFNVRTVN